MKKGDRLKKFKHVPRSVRWLLYIAVFLLVAYQIIAFITYSPTRAQHLGITFSKQYAEFLGLDWQQAYISLLDELNVKYIRLPIFWEEVEKNPGMYDFSDIDWQLQEAAKRGVKVALVLGLRQPRWPECHSPAWAKKLPPQEFKAALFHLLTLEAQRYGAYDAIDVLQVENEPLLDLFGECPNGDKDLLRQEVDLVRAISDKPIMITASGELAPWLYEGRWADFLGSTLYRITWNKHWGYATYWMIPPSLYRVKAFIFGHDAATFWISELQMEPWFPEGNINVPLEEQYKSASPIQLEKNLEYAYKTNAPRIYLWGAEWWIYTKEILKTDEIWETVKQFDWQ